MDTVYPHCAGLDVHKDTVVACVRHHDGGRRARQEVCTFPTHTRGLEELAGWLAAEGVTHAAMESTGVYWKPVFNIIGGRVAVLLVNAQHIKHVPGWKTDPVSSPVGRGCARGTTRAPGSGGPGGRRRGTGGCGRRWCRRGERRRTRRRRTWVPGTGGWPGGAGRSGR